LGFGSGLGLPHTGSRVRRARAHVCGVSGAPSLAAHLSSLDIHATDTESSGPMSSS